MKVGENWKLIDLDAAANIGEKAGLKSSTGYVPPELLSLAKTGEANLRDPTQTNALNADCRFDIWSLGALLYLLITGQTLLNNDQEDNLDEHDLIKLYKWNSDDLKAALSKVHNPMRGKIQPLGCDLLSKLLQPEADKRPGTISDVLAHPFFVGESHEELEQEIKRLQLELETAQAAAALGERDRTAIIMQQLEDLKRGQLGIQMTTEHLEREQKNQRALLLKQASLLEAVKDRTINIEATSETTFLQLCKTELVLLRGMFEATEVTTPTSFIITPNMIDPEGSPASSTPLIELAEDGSGIELGEAGEELKGKIEKRKGWFDKVCTLGSNVSDAVSGREGGLVVQAAQEFTDFVKEKLEDKEMYLYLIDEYTGNPVVPADQEDSRYPIKITEPSKNAVKLLPLMRAGLKVMSVANSAAFVGHMLGVPIPSVPKAWQEKASTAVGSLSRKSSVAEFDVLQEALDSEKETKSDGADKQQAIRGWALKEFEQFLAKEDPDNTFCGLYRLVSADGKACWTSLNQAEFEAEEAKKRGSLDPMEAAGADALKILVQEAKEEARAAKAEVEVAEAAKHQAEQTAVAATAEADVAKCQAEQRAAEAKEAEIAKEEAEVVAAEAKEEAEATKREAQRAAEKAEEEAVAAAEELKGSKEKAAAARCQAEKRAADANDQAQVEVVKREGEETRRRHAEQQAKKATKEAAVEREANEQLAAAQQEAAQAMQILEHKLQRAAEDLGAAKGEAQAIKKEAAAAKRGSERRAAEVNEELQSEESARRAAEQQARKVAKEVAAVMAVQQEAQRRLAELEAQLTGEHRGDCALRSPQKRISHRHQVAQVLDSHLNPRGGSDEGRVAVQEMPLLDPDAELGVASSQRDFVPSFSNFEARVAAARAAQEDAKKAAAMRMAGCSGGGGL
jgi:hypothetical protein